MVGASKPNTVPLELASVVMVARGEGTCLRGDLERENSVMRGEREEGREEGGGRERERMYTYLMALVLCIRGEGLSGLYNSSNSDSATYVNP